MRGLTQRMHVYLYIYTYKYMYVTGSAKKLCIPFAWENKGKRFSPQVRESEICTIEASDPEKN